MTLSYQGMRHKLIRFQYKNSDVLYRHQQRRILGTRANYLPNPIQIYKIKNTPTLISVKLNFLTYQFYVTI